MAVDTLGKKYEEVWVVYSYYKPDYAAFPPETHWNKFTTEEEAKRAYNKELAHPRALKIEEPRKYKLYRLDSKGG
jgi:hypothetical protein